MNPIGSANPVREQQWMDALRGIGELSAEIEGWRRRLRQEPYATMAKDFVERWARRLAEEP